MSGSTTTEPVFDAAERTRLLQQYAEIAAMAGGLAHEIRNPLSTISLNLELLAEDLQESESPRERRMLRKVQTIQKECVHLQSVLEDFLKFARFGEMHLEDEDLNETIRVFVESYRPLAREHGVEISPHLSSDLPPVRLDTSLFRQVLQNLAQNAQQAMPKGGRLELQTYVRDGRVQLDVIDSGVGMEPPVLARIFDVFYSTKPSGSGLGLPTVQKIVRAHGGEITADSTPGSGTRFTISLPPA